MLQEPRARARLVYLSLTLLFCTTLALGVLRTNAVGAQETPEPTPTAPLPTPVATHQPQETPALLYLVAPDRSVAVDEEFPIEVRLQDAQHVASFSFVLAFPQEQVEFLRAENVGAFLETSNRQLSCSDPRVIDRGLALLCATVDAPFCLGGAAGASGSGLLARATFRAESEGDVDFEFVESQVILDDLDPCDPNSIRTIDIPHRRLGATVRVGGGGGGAPWALIAGVAGGVALVLAVAGGGLAWYMGRHRTRPR